MNVDDIPDCDDSIIHLSISASDTGFHGKDATNCGGNPCYSSNLPTTLEPDTYKAYCLMERLGRLGTRKMDNRIFTMDEFGAEVQRLKTLYGRKERGTHVRLGQTPPVTENDAVAHNTNPLYHFSVVYRDRSSKFRPTAVDERAGLKSIHIYIRSADGSCDSRQTGVKSTSSYPMWVRHPQARHKVSSEGCRGASYLLLGQEEARQRSTSHQ